MGNFERNKLNLLVLNIAIEVHKFLGPGLPEEVYRQCFCAELEMRNLSYSLHPEYTLTYKDITLDHKIIADILIHPDTLVIIRASEPLTKLAESQVRSLLKLTNLYTGIIINFNVDRLIEGYKKISNPL